MDTAVLAVVVILYLAIGFLTATYMLSVLLDDGLPSYDYGAAGTFVAFIGVIWPISLTVICGIKLANHWSNARR